MTEVWVNYGTTDCNSRSAFNCDDTQTDGCEAHRTIADKNRVLLTDNSQIRYLHVSGLKGCERLKAWKPDERVQLYFSMLLYDHLKVVFYS